MNACIHNTYGNSFENWFLCLTVSNCSRFRDIMRYSIIALINPWTVVTKSYGKPETIDQREIETYIRFMHFLEKMIFLLAVFNYSYWNTFGVSLNFDCGISVLLQYTMGWSLLWKNYSGVHKRKPCLCSKLVFLKTSSQIIKVLSELGTLVWYLLYLRAFHWGKLWSYNSRGIKNTAGQSWNLHN